MAATSSRTRAALRIALAGFAAFAVYFCMYGFRKPFAVASWEDEAGLGSVGLKTLLVVAQLLGYTASKFLGISVCSGEGQRKRAIWLVGLILCAEAALLLLPVLPGPWKALALILNGLPLGMVWGLVVSYLEGRRAADGLMALLSCSFIVSSGFAKDVGRWVMTQGVSEAWMPAATGALFVLPLLASVWLLNLTPPPDADDIAARSLRTPMTAEQRKAFVGRFRLPLVLLISVYFLLTAFRDFRDNFAMEVLKELGGLESSVAFTRTELPVAFGVVATMALLMLVRNNRRALSATFAVMVAGLLCMGLSTLLFRSGQMAGPLWMTMMGLGAYAAYVPFNAVLFERVVAATRSPGNAVFAIYLADAFGYLGAVIVQAGRDLFFKGLSPAGFLANFSLVLSGLGVVAFAAALHYFLVAADRAAPGPEQEPA